MIRREDSADGDGALINRPQDGLTPKNSHDNDGWPFQAMGFSSLRPGDAAQNGSTEGCSIPAEGTRLDIVETEIDPVGGNPRPCSDQLTERC